MKVRIKREQIDEHFSHMFVNICLTELEREFGRLFAEETEFEISEDQIVNEKSILREEWIGKRVRQEHWIKGKYFVPTAKTESGHFVGETETFCPSYVWNTEALQKRWELLDVPRIKEISNKEKWEKVLHYKDSYSPDQVIKDLACFLDDCGIDATEAYKKMRG